MSVTDRWHKSRPLPGEPKCSCRPAKVPTAEHGQGKRWQVRWRDETGQGQKLNFETKPAAESKDAEIKASLDRGDYIDPKAGQVTLKTYGRQWRDTLTADPATLMQIDTRLGKWVFGRKISDYSMATLAKSPSLMQAWIKEMQEGGLQPSTLRGVVTWVSIIFNAALDDGIVRRNPLLMKSVRKPKVIPKQVVPWTLATLATVSGQLPERLAAMAYLGAGCGHRQGEAFAVAVDDIDFLQRVVHVRRQVRIIDGELVFSLPKKDKVRTVPLPDEIGLRLATHIQRFPPVTVTLPWRTPDGKPHTAELLFTSGGRAINRNGFNKSWRSARDKAGVPATRDNGMHVLRHTAASAWLAQGVDIRTVAEYLGHDDPGFTLRVYSHLMPDAADRARRAMNAFFEGAAEVPCALDVPSERSG